METIAHYESPIGVIEIKGDDTAVTSVLFRDAKKRKLSKSKPIKTISAPVKKCITALEAYFKKGKFDFNIPLSQEGTPLQLAVWNALLKVNPGKTVSYKDIAIKIKKPNAVRAVANAIGVNNLTILVPCHRVIGSNGKLTGYSGDLWRKKLLLEHEAKYAGK